MRSQVNMDELFPTAKKRMSALSIDERKSRFEPGQFMGVSSQSRLNSQTRNEFYTHWNFHKGRGQFRQRNFSNIELL